jgi:hypothetical protein
VNTKKNDTKKQEIKCDKPWKKGGVAGRGNEQKTGNQVYFD